MTSGNFERLGTASGLPRRLLALVVGFMLALLGLALAAGPAAAGNVVGPQPQNSILAVGPDDAAGQSIVEVRGPPLRPIVSATSVAADAGPAMTIDDAQFGAKVGKHARDYGLDPSDPAARSWVRGHIEDIRSRPDEIRQGPWNPKGGGGTDYLFYRQGADVVVTRGGGQFVTVLKGGQSNGEFQDATPR